MSSLLADPFENSHVGAGAGAVELSADAARLPAGAVKACVGLAGVSAGYVRACAGCVGASAGAVSELTLE